MRLLVDEVNRLEIATFMYKFYNNRLPVKLSKLFIINSKIHTHNTRQANDCHLQGRHTKLGQFSISFQGPKIWNEINTKIGDCKSLFLFQKILKRHLFTDDDTEGGGSGNSTICAIRSLAYICILCVFESARLYAVIVGGCHDFSYAMQSLGFSV